LFKLVTDRLVCIGFSCLWFGFGFGFGFPASIVVPVHVVKAERPPETRHTLGSFFDRTQLCC